MTVNKSGFFGRLNTGTGKGIVGALKHMFN